MYRYISPSGSSPRVRGTGGAAANGGVNDRFIPACAGNSRHPLSREGARPVHPRVCGEQYGAVAGKKMYAGSSPRVRGTAKRLIKIEFTNRFIPACAGNRIDARVTYAGRAVHPRVCGEQPLSGRASCRAPGSSPRVRGTGSIGLGGPFHSRFIPACAGNRPGDQRHDKHPAVHPRVCGEQFAVVLYVCLYGGSSPRVRGTARQIAPLIRQHRFIPACAGNSLRLLKPALNIPVHPRVCGEQSQAAKACPQHTGSSPRVRGTERIDHQTGQQLRFIPACAGNSPHLSASGGDHPVHPRVCGEQILSVVPCETYCGSSPRVRGTVLGVSGKDPSGRFIPACAGNRVEFYAIQDCMPVHPRVCGEQIVGAHGMMPCPGSSPRVRGTVFQRRFAIVDGRFIPACAGNRRDTGAALHDLAVHPRVCGEQPPPRLWSRMNRGSSPRVRGTVFVFLSLSLVLRFIPACAGNSGSTVDSVPTVPVHPRVCGEQRLKVLESIS